MSIVTVERAALHTAISLSRGFCAFPHVFRYDKSSRKMTRRDERNGYGENDKGRVGGLMFPGLSGLSCADCFSIFDCCFGRSSVTRAESLRDLRKRYHRRSEIEKVPTLDTFAQIFYYNFLISLAARNSLCIFYFHIYCFCYIINY